MNTKELINNINNFNYGQFYYTASMTKEKQLAYQQEIIRKELEKLTPGQLFKIREQITVEGQMFDWSFGKWFERAEQPTTPKKESFRSKVFRMAHALYKSGEETFAVCLARVWKVYRLKKKMLKGKVRFTYKKVDGSLRQATGTIKAYKRNSNPTSRKKNYSVFSYFDVEKQAFRSFKIENLITIYN